MDPPSPVAYWDLPPIKRLTELIKALYDWTENWERQTEKILRNKNISSKIQNINFGIWLVNEIETPILFSEFDWIFKSVKSRIDRSIRDLTDFGVWL